jgi:hypothetical protein
MKKENEKVTGTVAEQWKKAFAEISETIQDVVGVVSSVWGSITAIWGQALQNESTALDNDYKRRKANIEANVTDEEDRTAQLAALDEEYATKKHELAVKQFRLEQATAVSGVVFSTAQAVMQAFAQFGWPWGLIPAGFAIAAGAVQVGLILSEQPPEMALGGQSEKDQWAMVGERGKELAYLPRNAQVFSADKTERMMAGAGGGAVVNMYGDFYNDTDVDRTAAIMAAKLEAAMRGAA